jgi:hypothetical protein
MPWRVSSPMDEKILFIETFRAGVFNFAELCAFVEISRKTGDKWVQRWRAEDRPGLDDRSHATRSCPHRLRPDVAAVSPDHPPQALELGASQDPADPSRAATIPAPTRSFHHGGAVQTAWAGQAATQAAAPGASRPWSDTHVAPKLRLDR